MEAVSDLIFTSERHLAAEAANLPVDIAKARVSEWNRWTKIQASKEIKSKCAWRRG